MKVLNDVIVHLRRRPQPLKRPGNKPETPKAKPAWGEDGPVCTAPGCKTAFGMFNRRHHCRFCGALVCAECSKYRLPNKTSKKVVHERACKTCYLNWKDKDVDEGQTQGKTAQQVGTDADSVYTSNQYASRGTNNTMNKKDDYSKCPRCVALYDYNAEYEGDLSFVEGNTIVITNKDGDWWTGFVEIEPGKYGEQQGLFPSNYVEVSAVTKTNNSVEEETEPNDGDILEAICDYEPNNEEELGLKEGERVVLKMKDGSGWWLAEKESNPNCRGWVSPELVAPAKDQSRQNNTVDDSTPPAMATQFQKSNSGKNDKVGYPH
eukprot:UN25433